RAAPLRLPRRSEGLYLVQRIRDEAHRFALQQHQRQRRRTGLASQLDQVKGVGPARRKALLQHFGSLEAISQARVEDIAALPGISENLALRIKETLGEHGG
ncbi:MAG TPA: excinuclease ABC subunit C, partial [Chloroflexi bacterium]|nr:excinuclease ABC subunit C [Chloroflexota bacterium]